MLRSSCQKVVVILFAILSATFIMNLTACSNFFYKGYSGSNPDLYTVAINSLLWNKGHSNKSAKYCDSEISILENDEFGRTLFTYYEDYYTDISFSSLIIMQSSVDGYVYYYEDLNYLIKEQIAYSHTLEEFSQEEIDYLKEVNDWGKELDLSKCIKKQTIRNKQDVPTDTKTIEHEVREQFNVEDENIFINYLTSANNKNFVFYGAVRRVKEDNIYFAAFVNSEGEIIDWLVPQNLYSYQEELKNFKLKNGWWDE